MYRNSGVLMWRSHASSDVDVIIGKAVINCRRQVSRPITAKKHATAIAVACFFVCKDYKKDIFGRFAYDFELSQNILSFLI